MNVRILTFLISTLAPVYARCQDIPAAAFSKIKDHPRILLLKNEEERVSLRLSRDGTYNILHKIIIKECDMLTSTPPLGRELSGKRLLTTAREARRRIFFLSYGYRVTKNRTYLDRAEKELLAVARFSDWNPSHFLDVAEMTMGVAIGYDWLYDSLSVETRKELENAILVKGLQPSLQPEYTSWLNASHNWNQVCNASMAYGAIALLDKYPKLSTTILQRSVKSVQLAMNEYLPDGGYPEGYGYWSYGTTFNVLLISALEKAFDDGFGLSTHPGFLKTPYYLMNMTGPSGLPFNYSDCDGKALLNPAMGWFAVRTKDPSLMTFEMEIINGRKNLHRIRELPALMVWAADLDFNNIPTPSSLSWVGQGKTPVALIRSSWAKDTSIYVGLKGGSALTTHSHMDGGSFVMDALGERWAMDFGPQDYYSLESKGIKLFTMRQESDRWKVFRISNVAHNTLTINKNLQRVDGNATIISSTDNSAFRSATADLTSLYSIDATKVHRGIAIVNNQYVVVRDEIELKSPAVIRWNMLTDASVTIIDDKTAQLAKMGKKVILRVSEPSDAVLTTYSTDPPQAYDAPNPGTVFIGFETQKKGTEPVTLSVMLIPQDVSMENKMTIPVLSEWSSFNPME